MHTRSSIIWFSMADEKRRGRPRDPNQLAKLIVDMATADVHDRILTPDGRDAVAVALGRRGGLKGGKARAAALTPERRREIALKAATTRWGRDRDE